jgi:hypothetical protein
MIIEAPFALADQLHLPNVQFRLKIADPRLRM